MNLVTFLAIVGSVTVHGTESAVPNTVVIATARGETTIPVAVEYGHPTLPAPSLARVLPITGLVQDSWAVVTFAGRAFRARMDP